CTVSGLSLSSPIRRVAATALPLAVVIAAPLVVAMQAGGAAPPAPTPRTMLVAAFDDGAVSATPSGAGIAQLPWLLPGDGEPAISPDGTRVAFTSARGGDLDVYVADSRSGAVARISS